MTDDKFTYRVVQTDQDGFLLQYGDYDTAADADHALCHFGPPNGFVVKLDQWGDRVDD